MAWTASGHAYVGRSAPPRRRFVASGSAHVGVARSIPVRQRAPTRHWVARGSASVGARPQISRAQIHANQQRAIQRTHAHYARLRQQAQSKRWRAHGTAHVGPARQGLARGIPSIEAMHAAENRFDRSPAGQLYALKDILGSIGEKPYAYNWSSWLRSGSWQPSPVRRLLTYGQDRLRTGVLGKTLFGLEQQALWKKAAPLLGGRMPRTRFADTSSMGTRGGGQVAAYVPRLGANRMYINPRYITLGIHPLIGAVFGHRATGEPGAAHLTLHEWAHTRQSPRTTANSTPRIEGGADAFADTATPVIAKQLHWPTEPQVASPEYAEYKRRFNQRYGRGALQQAVLGQFRG